MNKTLSVLLYGVAGEGEQQPAEFDWGSLFDEPSDEPNDPDTDVDPAPVETPPAKEEIAPEPKVEEEPAKVEEDPQPTPEPKVEEPVIPEPVVEQPKQLTKEEQQAQLDQFRGELEGMYKISKDDADALTTDPESVFPKLAANLHMQIMTQVVTLLQQHQSQLPQVVEQTARVVKSKEDAANKFQERWPELLATPEGQKVAAEAAQIVRTRNPKASLEDVIEKSGKLAYTLLGKDIPVVGTVAPKVAAKPKPHVPASTKSAPVVTQQPNPEADFYASFGDNFKF
jgi:hypothetical protein